MGLVEVLVPDRDVVHVAIRFGDLVVLRTRRTAIGGVDVVAEFPEQREDLVLASAGQLHKSAVGDLDDLVGANRFTGSL